MAGLLDFLRGERGVLAQEQPTGLLGALSQTGAAPTYAQQAVSALTRLPSALFQPGYMQEPTSLAADLARKAFWRGSVLGVPEEVKRRDVQRGIDVALANLTAYHGSPHKFDKFDMSKIGTGEGAQAYGHGLYFAENPAVANTYKDKAPMVLQSKQAQWHFNQIIDKANAGPYPQAAGGHLYKVDVPDDAVPKMLDWDAPLSRQPSSAQIIARDLGLTGDVSGKDLYTALVHQARDAAIARGQNAATTLDAAQAAASADLAALGIPGIRYLDAGSRGQGTGTRNFVVFDDQLPKILSRE